MKEIKKPNNTDTPESKTRSRKSVKYVAGTPKKNKSLTVKNEKKESLPAKYQENPADKNIVRIRTSPDRIMITLILVLLCLGTVMVFSASFPDASSRKGNSLWYIERQLIFVVVGLVIMFAASLIPYRFYKKVTPHLYVVTLGLLVLVLILGVAEGTAKRWIQIPGIPFTIQPSEIMKLSLVMMLAWYIEKYRDKIMNKSNNRESFFHGVIVPGVFIAAACGLVLLEKHLSGTLILAAIGLIVVFIGTSRPITAVVTYAAAGLGAGIVFLLTNPYAMSRITTFTDENPNLLAEKWQTTQGILAIGSGGFLGVGLGNSRQKYSYVSEPQNDFIFTIWCEEMGFVGAVFLIALYLLFIWRGYIIAMRAPDTYSSLVAFGITSKVGIQALLNIGVVTDILPNTGVALPFFSYGGSFLLILLAEMGVLLSISRHSYQKK